MAAVEDILNQLPIDQLAQQVGADEASTHAAAQQAIPALMQGMQANARDEGGARSLAEAIGQHQGGEPDLSSVDQADGQKIVSNIFGGNTDAVVNQLGGGGASGAGGDLLRKLMPILAPLVMSYIANKVLKGGQGGTGAQTGGQGGGLGDILGDILGGGQQQAPQGQAPQQPGQPAPAPQGDGTGVPPAGQPIPEPVGQDGQPAPAPQGQPQQAPAPQGQQQAPAPQGGGLSDILGDLLGGGGSASQGQQQGGGLGNILGDLLGQGKRQ